MDNNKNKGLKPFFFGLLALTVFNCSAVKTGDLSQTPNTVEISPTVQKSVSSGQASGVLRLTVADVRTEHLNALQGHFAIASVEVRAGKAHDEESRKSRETENSQENDSNPWISVSNYDAKGKSYEITPGDAATYPVDMYLLPSGDYRNIRIKLVDGQSQVLALDGTSSTWHNVKTPSAGESGLKLRGSFTVEDNMMTTVSFNLELEKTREEHKDNAKNDKKQKEHRDSSNNADYLIKPEIRFASATTGNLPAVDSVAFSPAAGAYNANQSVAMTSTTIGASVCYTADGTIPACDALASCTAGNAYTGAVSVASSQTLTAIACKTGYSASAPVSSAYAIDKPPTVPASFVAKNVSSSQIDLSWSSSTDDLTASSALTYEICQSTVSGACLKFSPVYVTVPGVIAYSATGLAPATTYFFSVRAKDQSGNASAASAEISASTSAVSAWAVQYPVPNLLTGVTDNGREKMVTGNNGLLISSQDGINWFSEFVLSGSNINSVTNTSRGEYVAVGDSGVILYSTTTVKGRIWSGARQTTTGNLNSVANGGLIVVVGDAGTSLYSKEGATWYSSVMPTAENYRSVKWTGSVFVAAGNQGTICTSVDGVSWTVSRSLAARPPLYGAAGNGSIIVVVGAKGATYLSTDNGANFNGVPHANLNTLNDVAWDGSRFIAAGDLGTIITSVNGLQWKVESPVVKNNLRHVSGYTGTDGLFHDTVVGDLGTILNSL